MVAVAQAQFVASKSGGGLGPHMPHLMAAPWGAMYYFLFLGGHGSVWDKAGEVYSSLRQTVVKLWYSEWEDCERKECEIGRGRLL